MRVDLFFCLGILCTLSSGVVVVDFSQPVVFIDVATVGSLLEVAYPPGTGVVQTQIVGGCVATTSLNPIVSAPISPSGGVAPLTIAPVGGQELYVAAVNGSAVCLHVLLVTYDQLIDVSVDRLPFFPVSVLAGDGSWIVFFSNETETLLPVTDSKTLALDTRPSAPPVQQWSLPTPFSTLQVNTAQQGNTYELASSIHAGVRVWLVVPSALDVVVTLNATLPTTLDVSVQLGARIIWQLVAPTSPAVAYLRLADASGNVVPFNDFLYTLVYGSQPIPNLFPNDQTPLQYRHVYWATPAHTAPGVWSYRNMFQSTPTVAYRALVPTNGVAPTVAPPINPPNWQDYFALSERGIRCECSFGDATACANQ